MESRQCPQCGRLVDEQARTCGSCGAALAPSSPPPALLAEDGGLDEVPAPEQRTAVPANAAPSPSAYPSPSVYPGAPGYPPPYPPYPAYPYSYGQPAAYPGAPAAYPGANGAASAPTPMPAPAPAPGYPAYPQGAPAAYAPYLPAPSPYGMYGYPAYGYAYPYSYPYGYPVYAYPVYWKPPRAPGETHALVVSWIVTVFGGLSILCGLLVGLALGLAAATPTGESLGTLAELLELTIAPLLGGGFAVYFGIRGILRKPSARFRIPSPLLFLALTVVVLGVGVVLWHVAPPPAAAALPLLPLLYLAGILPAFTILAFTARRLGLPSTRRHVWMSLLYGLTLAPLLAIILEAIAALIIGGLSGIGSGALSVPANVPDTGLLVFILLLMVSVVAPLVEEGVKPLGAVLLMRRLRTPASAFLLGMAAGVGFDITETIGYIGMGQADWIGVAIERVGAGLLHGVGAGMAALGWYYLINGKGIPGRWGRGIGCILYAVVQHAVFNGLFVVALIPAFGPWLSQPWYIGRLPFPNADFLDFALYVIILGVLYVVTGRLARGARPPATAVAAPDAGLPAKTRDEAGPATVGSGAR